VDTLDPEALAPFRAAIEAGVRSIMTAHIVVRSLGEVPATMSSVILQDLLRGELEFDGMVVTDALEMKAISDTVGVEEGAVRSIAAAPTPSASATTSSTSPSSRSRRARRGGPVRPAARDRLARRPDVVAALKRHRQASPRSIASQAERRRDRAHASGRRRAHSTDRR
jgi:beta-glucosidase-like glycosyl hydrolase